MKAVMRELAQAKRHYSKLPLFEFLRCETIPPRDRLALRVFELFSDWTTELLAYSKNALAHTTVPHVLPTARAYMKA